MSRLLDIKSNDIQVQTDNEELPTEESPAQAQRDDTNSPLHDSAADDAPSGDSGNGDLLDFMFF